MVVTTLNFGEPHKYGLFDNTGAICPAAGFQPCP